jgi:hypothetical protein
MINANTPQISPELLAQLSEMGIAPDELDMLHQQVQRAQALRNTPGAQGREVGRTYVASSPLEHLAVGLQRVQGQQGIQGGEQSQAALLQRLQAKAQALGMALRGGGQQQGPPQPPLDMPPGLYPGVT